MDLYYLDGSVPPPDLLNRFIQKCEETPGAVAVHCKAGLGRTGTCIGCYVMKHFRFTAEEIIGWLRIARPGSVIGPQQQFMKDVQARMWKEGDVYRQRVPGNLGLLGKSPSGRIADSSENGAGQLSSETDLKLPSTLVSGVASLAIAPSQPARQLLPATTAPPKDVIPKVASNGSSGASVGSARSALSSNNGTVPLPLIGSSGAHNATAIRPNSSSSSGNGGGVAGESKTRDRGANGTVGSAAGVGAQKEQGDFLRLRRQQIVEEQKQTGAVGGALSQSTPAISPAPTSRASGFTSAVKEGQADGFVPFPSIVTCLVSCVGRFRSSFKVPCDHSQAPAKEVFGASLRRVG
eukprot:gene258-267_t